MQESLSERSSDQFFFHQVQEDRAAYLRDVNYWCTRPMTMRVGEMLLVICATSLYCMFMYFMLVMFRCFPVGLAHNR